MQLEGRSSGRPEPESWILASRVVVPRDVGQMDLPPSVRKRMIRLVCEDSRKLKKNHDKIAIKEKESTQEFHIRWGSCSVSKS